MSEELTPIKKARLAYERKGRGKVKFRVQMSKNDDEDLWDRIVDWLTEKGNGNAKKGLEKIAEKYGKIK